MKPVITDREVQDWQTKTGDYAFPRPVTPDEYGQQGMTLRDWFAGMALTGIIAFEGTGKEKPTQLGDSRQAYQLADAMLAAREEQ